jgi:hypothetical protein
MTGASVTTGRLEFNLALSNATLYISNVVLSVVPIDTVVHINFPFPHNAVYPYGIKPTNYTQAQMNGHCQAWFDKIVAKYITTNGCAPGQYRYQRLETGDKDTLDTVSESIGYGMLMTVYMENAQNHTKKYFDGMYNYYMAHLDAKGLMNWRISKDNAVLGSGAATDGDLDAVFALFMAHKQWGSAGAINYLQRGKDLAALLLNNEVTASNDIRPGDSWDIANISYFAPAYFKIFAGITGDTRWNAVAQKTYTAVVNTYYNSTETFNTATGLSTGLMPNWCSYSGVAQSPGTWAMDANSYWWDACRFPWRQGYDYLLNGTTNSVLAQTNTQRVSRFFKKKYNGNPALITSHYKLNGDQTIWNGTPNGYIGAEDTLNLAGITGSTAVAAMVDNDQVWLNSLYDRLVKFPMCETNVNWGSDYFNDVLKMLYMLVLSGNQPDLYSPPNIITAIPFGSSQEPKHTYGIKMLPQTSGDGLKIEFNLPLATNADISVTDLCGKTLLNKSFHNLQEGRHEWSPEASRLAPGIYVVQVKTGYSMEVKKVAWIH